MSQIQKLQHPIITGRPQLGGQPAAKPQESGQSSFRDLLEQQIQQQAPPALTFSRHAQARTEQRGIGLSEADMARLGQAVEKAQDKGLRDTLVLMDQTAFIVNIPNRVVVTVVDGNEAESTVFTNIDGAVIV